MATDEDDDYGDELVYDSELDETLRNAETEVPDIEDAVQPQALAPFDEFRQRGFLSVSDLVATVWCEVQFDYRLRTLPYLPVTARPKTITSTKGTSIAVDQVKVEGKERILKRGETIHKRLEREIHPAEVKVVATSREDAWGLRMLNMFSALEALLTLGKCRELPVAGFVDDVLVLGIIDEITREPIADSPTKGRQTRSKRAESGRQASLNDFFGGKPLPQPQTHRLRVSDSKTRASGVMPREEDTLAGRLQVMLYKELVDALLVPQDPRADVLSQHGRAEAQADVGGPSIPPREERSLPSQVADHTVPPSPPENYLPTSNPVGSGLWRVWEYLGLDPSAQFTDEFIAQSRPVVESNLLRFGVSEGRNLADFAQSWTRYVAALGLGAGPEDGRTDRALELVYRRAAPKRKKEAARKRRKEGKRRDRKKRVESETQSVQPATVPALEGVDVGELDEDAQLHLALQLSLQGVDQSEASQPTPQPMMANETPTADANESTIGVVGEPTTSHEIALATDRERTLPTTPPLATTVPIAGHVLPNIEMASLSQACEPPPGPMSSPPVGQASSSLVDSLLGSAPRSTPLGYRPTPSYTQRSVSNQTKYFTSDSEREREDAELAWAVEMSLNAGGDEPVPAVAGVGVMSSPLPTPARRSRSRTPSPPRGTASGSIIGRHRFVHDPPALAAHLRSVLEYWRGTREPHGVSPANVRRCQWCEFEDGCEWRQAKAQEALEQYRALRM